MAKSSIRMLLADDFYLFRRLLRLTLQNELELGAIVEASDGREAIELAQALQPDLILLDIGLPKLDGIEAARRIRELAPRSKILFVSQESSIDIVQTAFSVGASGYVVKMDVGNELLTAVKAVLRGERFVGSRFAGHGLFATSDAPTPGSARGNEVFAPLQRENIEIAHRHEAGFYSDDASLLDGFTQFVGAALKAGNSAIVVATESHRDGLLPRLQAHGLDIGAAIEQGRYISVDAADVLSTFMVKSMPDPLRFLKVAGDLIVEAAKAVKGEYARVAACGECAPLLWAQGNAESAIRLEHLWDEIAKTYGVAVLCGLPTGQLTGRDGQPDFRQTGRLTFSGSLPVKRTIRQPFKRPSPHHHSCSIKQICANRRACPNASQE